MESCPKATVMEPRNKVISGTVWAPLLLFSHSVVSDSLRLHGLQHARFPCPSVSPRLCSIHIQWVGDTIQPSYSLLPPSAPALNLFQHQGLFQWIGYSHQVAKVLELQLQHQSSNEYSGLTSFRLDWFDFLAVKGLSRLLSITTGRRHEFCGTRPSLRSNPHIPMWLLEKHLCNHCQKLWPHLLPSSPADFLTPN